MLKDQKVNPMSKQTAKKLNVQNIANRTRPMSKAKEQSEEEAIERFRNFLADDRCNCYKWVFVVKYLNFRLPYSKSF